MDPDTPKRVLVLGASGFLGEHIDERRGFEPSRLDQGRRSGAPALADKLRQQRLGTAWQWWTGPADFDWGPYRPAIERWRRVMGQPPHPVDDRNRLAPSFVEWMMGFPAGWTDGMTRTQALKALGKAVVPHQGAAAIGLLSARIESEERT